MNNIVYQCIFKVVGKTTISGELLSIDHLICSTINREINVGKWYEVKDKISGEKIRQTCRICLKKYDNNLPRILSPEFLSSSTAENYPNKYMIRYNILVDNNGEKEIKNDVIMKLNYPYEVEDISDFRFIIRQIRNKKTEIYEPQWFIKL